MTLGILGREGLGTVKGGTVGWDLIRPIVTSLHCVSKEGTYIIIALITLQEFLWGFLILLTVLMIISHVFSETSWCSNSNSFSTNGALTRKQLEWMKH